MSTLRRAGRGLATLAVTLAVQAAGVAVVWDQTKRSLESWSSLCDTAFPYSVTWLVCGKAEPGFYAYIAISGIGNWLVAVALLAPFILGQRRT
jgi:hypothetical protein